MEDFMPVLALSAYAIGLYLLYTWIGRVSEKHKAIEKHLADTKAYCERIERIGKEVQEVGKAIERVEKFNNKRAPK